MITVGSQVLRDHLEAIRLERDRPFKGDNYLAMVDTMARINYHVENAIKVLDQMEDE